MTDMAGDSFTLSTFYKQWLAYQDQLKASLAPLTDEQLALRPTRGLRSIGENATHIVDVRAGWFVHVLLEDGDDIVRAALDWGEPGAPPHSADDLVRGLDSTWRMMSGCLARWSDADMRVTFTDEWDGETVELSRAWVVWHLIEHDLHHGGELSLTLGMHRIPAHFTS